MASQLQFGPSAMNQIKTIENAALGQVIGGAVPPIVKAGGSIFASGALWGGGFAAGIALVGKGLKYVSGN